MSGRAYAVLLFAVLLLHSLAAAQSPQSIADVQISSISGCVDTYPVTVNCSVGQATLIIQTAAGFPAGRDLSTEPVYITARLNNYTYFTSTNVQLNPNDPTNTSVLVNVTATAYYPHINGMLVSVMFIDYYSPGRPSSAEFAGFSYRFEGPPTLLSISGCNGSGASTLNCVPDSSTVELTGSGLLWLTTGYRTQLNIGSVSSRTLYNSLTVVNDTYATLSLQYIYGTLLKPQHYSGVLLALNFTSTAYSADFLIESFYTTNSLYISFVPLPPPTIQQCYIGSCGGNTQNGSITTYYNCLPVLSLVSVYGTYLYDAQVTFGGVPCLPSTGQSRSADWYYCKLPNFDYDPSIAYDIVVYNDAGSATVPGVVRYTSAPILFSIDPCIDRGEWYDQYYGVQCPVGTTITLRGSRFAAADAAAVQFVPYYTSAPLNVSLLAPTLINSTTLTATLPALDSVTAASVYRVFGRIQAAFPSFIDAISTTNTLTTTLYISPNTPSITSVTSTMCDSVSALQLTNCHAMATITVVGTNLAVYDSVDLATSIGIDFQGWNYLSAPALDTSAVASNWYNSLTNTTLVFTLDYFSPDVNTQLQPDVVYTLLVYARSTYSFDGSNAFRLSLTYGTGATTTSSNKLSSGTIAGIAVTAVVVALLLVLLVVRLVRRQLSGGSSAGLSKATEEGSHWSVRGGREDYKDVELH